MLLCKSDNCHINKWRELLNIFLFIKLFLCMIIVITAVKDFDNIVSKQRCTHTQLPELPVATVCYGNNGMVCN